MRTARSRGRQSATAKRSPRPFRIQSFHFGTLVQLIAPAQCAVERRSPSNQLPRNTMGRPSNVVVMCLMALCVALDVPTAAAQSARGAGSITLSASPCNFTMTQPRYSQVVLDALMVWNANPQSPASIFLNDALLRTVTRQLGLAACQVELTQGQPCSVALAEIACPDPLWLCGGQLTLSSSVYQAARSGLCTGIQAADASVCKALLEHPEIVSYVTAGDCEPVCFAELASTGTTTELAAPAPAPSALDSCFSFGLTVAEPTQAGAAATAAALRNATTRGALMDALASFAVVNQSIRISMGDTGERHGPLKGAGWGMLATLTRCPAASCILI